MTHSGDGARIWPLWIRRFVFLVVLLLLMYVAQASERVEVSLHVTHGRCTAELYGRSTAIDCPALASGASLRPVHIPFELGQDDPSWRLRPSWRNVRITGADGRPLAEGTALPHNFDVHAEVLAPNGRAGLVLFQSTAHDFDARDVSAWPAWVFIIDAANRRGEWWQWSGAPWEMRGGPSVPLRGIPIDRPLGEQLKPVLNFVLAGGGVALAWALLLMRREPETGNARDRMATPAPLAEARPSRRLLRLGHRAAGRATRYAVAALCLGAFAVALHVSVAVLDGIPHVQDSVTYLFQAQTLARGALTAPAPPLATDDTTAHFQQEFLLLRDGRWFGKYPPGWPALLAVGVGLGAPWLINPLLAALTISLIYKLARALARWGAAGDRSPQAVAITAALATFLLATSPFFLIMSGSLMAHPAELLWTTLFMLGLALSAAPRFSSGPISPPLIVAGLALGALFLTRQYTAALVGLGFGGVLAGSYVIWNLAPGHHRTAARATALKAGLARAGIVLLAALPFVLALPLYQAAVTGDAQTDPRLLYWAYDRVGFGPGVGEPQNAFTMTMTTVGPAVAWYTDPDQPPRGHTPARGLYNLGRNLEALASDLFGWPPITTLVFVWMAFLLRRPAAGDWALLLAALAVAGGYVTYWAAGIAYGPRYLYAALPALVILTARGCVALVTDAGRRGRVPAVALVLVLLAYNLYSLPGRVQGYSSYNFVTAAPRSAVEAAAQPPALILVTASDVDWWEFGAFFSGNTPWLDGSFVYARDLGPTENARLRAHFPEHAVYRWTGERLVPEG